MPNLAKQRDLPCSLVQFGFGSNDAPLGIQVRIRTNSLKLEFSMNWHEFGQPFCMIPLRIY